MARKKSRRVERQQPFSPFEFRDAYLRAVEEALDFKPDAERVFCRFPSARIEEAPLAPPDRELLSKVGLPRRWSMNGFYGVIQVDDSPGRLLERLGEVCHVGDAPPEWADHLILATFGAVDDESPNYITLSAATGSVWFIQVEERAKTFVNSSLRAYAECLLRLRGYKWSLQNVVEETLTKDGGFDERRTKKVPETHRNALRTIDPACMEPSVFWPQAIDAELDYWLPDSEAPLLWTPQKVKAKPKPWEEDSRNLAEVLHDLIDKSNYFTGPPLTNAMIRSAEKELGYRLPKPYIQLLRIKNGVSLKRECFPTEEKTSWDYDHVHINGIYGIGGKKGIDAKRGGSRYMIDEWGYPDVGIVIGATPSSGHTTIMLDYSECGPKGEPRVVWVEAAEVEDEENWILVLAPNFESFLRGLREYEDI